MYRALLGAQDRGGGGGCKGNAGGGVRGGGAEAKQKGTVHRSVLQVGTLELSLKFHKLNLYFQR